MINIALIQLSAKHTEIFGTLIEFFLKKKFNITIYYDLANDPYSFVPYYEKIFKIKLDIKTPDKLLENRYNHDFFIFTSSADDIRLNDWFKLPENSNKCIFIQHQAAHWKEYMKWNITVSPVIQPNANNITIIPIYKSYSEIHCKTKETNIGLIGAIRPHQNDKDLNILIDLLHRYPNNDYSIYIFMRRMDWKVISNKNPFLKNNPRIKVFSGLKTSQLIEKLKEIKFLLPLSKKKGWYYWQRLTGTIPIAINLNIPLIMDKELASIYGLEDSSILYERNVSEIMDRVLGMSDEEYYGLIERQCYWKLDVYKRNVKLISEFLQNMVKK